MNTECDKCIFKDDCVNVGVFKDEDCLQFKEDVNRKMTIKEYYQINGIDLPNVCGLFGDKEPYYGS